MTEHVTAPTSPPQSFVSLAEKINGLDLTADEEQALGVLLGAVPTDEVEGFGWNEGVAAVVDTPKLPIRGFNIGMPPAARISAELGAGRAK